MEFVNAFLRFMIASMKETETAKQTLKLILFIAVLVEMNADQIHSVLVVSVNVILDLQIATGFLWMDAKQTSSTIEIIVENVKKFVILVKPVLVDCAVENVP